MCVLCGKDDADLQLTSEFEQMVVVQSLSVTLNVLFEYFISSTGRCTRCRAKDHAFGVCHERPLLQEPPSKKTAIRSSIEENDIALQSSKPSKVPKTVTTTSTTTTTTQTTRTTTINEGDMIPSSCNSSEDNFNGYNVKKSFGIEINESAMSKIEHVVVLMLVSEKQNYQLG
jgi:hypothetical protein